ncbi:TonB-dependent receptor [Paracrocinitomix mangrovi]|uniref:TonB-dependent receptor n=1 Tax=Paracrocinitomix mangrovi TaxID=2862509 RepID=UPI001C8D6D14|nr:TonB-dependent receptor [Paracrocinitomix mangrovi]UKN02281.1 TonB-dependent receptor [Paracrocinitomix mangrovi]
MRKLLSILFICLNATIFAQKIKVKGNIVDTEGNGIERVKIKVDGIQGSQALTNALGDFTLELPPNDTYIIRARFAGTENLLTEVTVDSVDIHLGKFILDDNVLTKVTVVGGPTGDFIDKLPHVDLFRITSVQGNAEDYIKMVGLGVSSNNELTANYNVRGGNYDENLIYVNGIQIYRPFLVRSGQQEGLSFINSAFVENISFSAGGFDAYYGDKLSSVLDIKYREPLNFGGSAQASLMGGQAHIEGVSKNKRFNYITGARYRANSYILSALPTQGDYNPTFFDYQVLTNYYLNYNSPDSYTKLILLGHYSNNNYRFVPTTRLTNWGTVNEAYQLRVFYEGQEETKFQTFTAATGVEWRKNKNLKTDFIASVFHSIESEHFDILGQYWINQLETDPSKEEFGDSTSNVGVGGFLDHGRNDLNVWIGNVYMNSKYTTKRKSLKLINGEIMTTFGEMRWGAKAQYELFNDVLSEWHMIDSAGYSLPIGNPDEIELQEVIKQDNRVETYRFTAHYQFTQNWVRFKSKPLSLKKKIKNDSTKYFIYKTDTLADSPAKFSMTLGTRGGFRTYNEEYWITPRLSMTYTPRSYILNEDSTVTRRNMKFRFASGLYYQPPLYRTMRGILGTINPDVVSQKSFHNVLGMDVYFKMWNRPFKFVTEAYYKYMWDVVPYEIDNVRIRYYGENSAVAYAYGLDAKIHGEFIKGVESFFRVGFLKTAEDIKNDDYYIYLNSDGDTIIQGYTFNSIATDSILQSPGYIPRPTDQTFTFSLFFQDHMPRVPDFKVSVNLLFGTPLPYGPPTYERYKDVLRTDSYFRVDLGFMYDFINPQNKDKVKDKKFFNKLDQLTVSLDAFNLLGINNVISYQWLQDVSARYYAIPNHLTGRRLNLRLIVKW